MKLEFTAFIVPGVLDKQTVAIEVNGTGATSFAIYDGFPRMKALFLERAAVGQNGEVSLAVHLPDCASPHALGLNRDVRRLGICVHRLSWRVISKKPAADDWIWQLGRPVGGEARKTFDQKVESGFWERFVTGPHVLDIGFKGYEEVKGVVPISPTAIGLDLDYPGYDGRTLPFGDGTQDAVYSSHCLEHITDYVTAIREWLRVTKVGGHVITVVPHAHLYERRHRPPSNWNQDHKRFYTPASLLSEFEEALPANAYRVRFLEDGDGDYVYADDPTIHPSGCYEITLVIQKITPPPWSLTP